MIQEKSPIIRLLWFLLGYWLVLTFIYYFYAIYIICELVKAIHYNHISIFLYPIFIVITLIISYIVIIRIILLANEAQRPIPDKIKIKLFLSPLVMAIILWPRYYLLQEWDFSKYKSNNANECFERANFDYLPNLLATEQCKLDDFKYLKTKFKNVAVVKEDYNSVTYRIGNMNNDAILGKDYIILQKNNNVVSKINLLVIPYYIIKTNLNGLVPFVCWYSLVEKGTRKSYIRTFKTFNGNIYTKACLSFTTLIYWIENRFKELKIKD